MNRHIILFVVAVLAVIPGLIQAETIIIPLGQQSSDWQSLLRPERNATQEDVLTNFGEPLRRHRAVGTPPISSWEYAEFIVFFEYERVLHSVLKRKTQITTN